MTLKSRQEEIKKELGAIENWEDRYILIIDWGKRLPSIGEELKKDDYLIKGCQSKVWLHAELTEDKKVKIVGDSDALIVRGLVAVILRAYSDSSPQEILQDDASFLKDLGFNQNLSPSRTNGINSMLKQIKMFALAFDYKLKSQVIN